jgi:hypothetical protein
MSNAIPRRVLLVNAAVLCLGGMSGRLGAQVGNPHTIESQLTVSVPMILRLAGLDVADIRQSRTHTEVRSRVLVRGNVGFQLSVRSPASHSPSGSIEVRGMDGAWTKLVDGEALLVAVGEAGESAREVSCRAAGPSSTERASECGLTYQLTRATETYALQTEATLTVASLPSDAGVEQARAPGTFRR